MSRRGWARREAAESERLDLQARAWHQPTLDLLARLGIGPGDSVIDLGCGPRGILDLASRLVGSGGRVVGLEAAPVRAIGARLNALVGGWPAVEVIQGDATATGLPEASFDLVHARFLAPECDPVRLAAEMVRLVRPGGVVAVQEPGPAPWAVDPEPEGWRRLAAAIHASFVRHPGADGGSMAAGLVAAGLEGVVAREVRLSFRGDHEYRSMLRFAFDGARDGLIATGEYSRAELARASRLLGRVTGDPAIRHHSFSVVQAYGRRPTAAGG